MMKGIVAVLVVLLVASVSAMPLAPWQHAAAMVQPWYDTMDELKAKVVAGEITVEEYEARLIGLRTEIEIKTVVLIAIRDSPTIEDKVGAVYKIMDYKPIRGCRSTTLPFDQTTYKPIGG